MPVLQDAAAIRRWNDYFAEVDRLLAMAGENAAEMRSDLQAHLADSFAAGDPQQSESARLEHAIGRLGRPAEYLHPLIADELLDRGTRTYNPAPIARGLYFSLLAGPTRALVAAGFGIGYLLLAAFTAMALLKPFWGEHVGLFRQIDGTLSFGIVANTADARELLGLWIVPIAITVAAVLYVILTRGLRAAKARQ